ncbi:MAG: signal peptidase I [Clostridiales bacterium]|nr:signal peptidase I [Clostridiales bacterium]HOA84402.1 signal peptidase I [Bacillota bacterium]
MKKAKKWLGIAGNVLLWLFVAFSVVITVLVFAANADDDGIPSIRGKSPITIVSDSMSPTFKAGDLIIGNKLTDAEKPELEVGDIITYYVDLDGDGKKEINTHRIVDKYTDQGGYVYYVTQGDNTATNPTPDADPVVYYDVICRYTGTKIAGLGKVLSFLQTSRGFLICIVLPLLLFFIYELYRFISVVVEVKSKKGVKLTAEEEEEIKRRAIEEYLASKKAAQAEVSDSGSTEGHEDNNDSEPPAGDEQ